MDHATVYFWQTCSIFEVFRPLVTIFVLLFVNLIQHIWFRVYQIYTQRIWWTNFVQKHKIVTLSLTLLFSCGIHYFHLWLEVPFLSEFGPNTQNCQFRLKLDIHSNWNKQNLVVMSTFSVFDWKKFLGKFGPKSKISSFSWNVLPRLRQVSRVQWWCSLFLYLIGDTRFGWLC